MTRTLKTSRLLARPIHSEDWPLIHAIQSDAEHGYWVRGPFEPATLVRSKRITRRLTAEALWGFISRVHRQGLGYEAMKAVLQEARPPVEQILTWTLPENVASRSLMDRLGFRYQHERMYANLRHVLYRLDA